jgi:hypothetical protein
LDSWGLIPIREMLFCSHSVHTGFGVHVTFCKMGTGIKVLEHEADHLPPSKKLWNYTSALSNVMVLD